MYTREHPSQRYKDLIRLNTEMHNEGEKHLQLPAKETFTGQSLFPHIERIQTLIDETKSKSLLDYGCGKAAAYNADYPPFRIDTVALYDPCVEKFNALALLKKKYDGVICTDVLEHCPVSDIEWILEEIFSCAKEFVYINVSTRAAGKKLSTGENAHETIRPLTWWIEIVRMVQQRFENSLIVVMNEK